MKNFSPNIMITLLVVLLVIAVAFIYRDRMKTEGDNAIADPSTLASNAEVSESGFSPTGEYYNPSPITGTPTPSQAPLTVYIYPGAEILNQTELNLQLESEDDAQVITDWYKKMITDLNYNAKSFAQTSTNGVVFNKLSAVRPGENLEINIKKDQNTSIVVITVDRS